MSTAARTGRTPTDDPEVVVGRFRRMLVGLSAATAAGSAVELAALRHWKDTVQLVPWAVVAVVALSALVLTASRFGRVGVLLARVVGLGSFAGAAFGIWEHVASNMETGALDARYQYTWDSMSLGRRAWLAASGGAGAAPPLAPGFLALSGLLLLMSTLWLPRRLEGRS